MNRLFVSILLILASLSSLAPAAGAQQRRDITAAERAAQAKAAENKRKIKVEKPDLEKIKAETLNLGYMFQEDYDPYRTSPYSGVTDALRRKAKHTKEEIDTIRKYAELSLHDNPFDLRQMSFLVHVLKEKEKNMSAKIWEYRLEHLLGAIKSTGTGEDTDNAWYVIYPAHEYDMVQLLGYEATDVKFIDPGFDYLSVRAEPETAKRLRDKVAKGFYFDVTIPGEQYELKHPDGDVEAVEEAVETDVIPAGEEIDPDDIPAE